MKKVASFSHVARILELKTIYSDKVEDLINIPREYRELNISSARWFLNNSENDNLPDAVVIAAEAAADELLRIS